MKAYKELSEIFTSLSHLNHLAAIASWDEAVMMPAGGGVARGKAMATLRGFYHDSLTQKKVADLIEKAKSENLPSLWDKANLYWMEKAYLNATCLDTKLVKALTQASITCEQAWRDLREKNNWHEFMPLLEKTFALVKEAATIRAEIFNMSVYDVLLDDYSPGVNQALIDPIFTKLQNHLETVLADILVAQKEKKINEIRGKFPVAKQKVLALQLMKAIGFDFNHGRLDVSHHPFCGGVSQDVRITTRYNEDEFITAAMAICHETGHAMYERGLPEAWLEQPVGQALGMSVHESQSLLIEMQACRSHEFMQYLAPLIKEHFGDDAAFSEDNLYHIYTQVKPGLIRVDADEITYPLHVIMRYQIEKRLMNDDISIADLPDIWNEYMQRFFNLNTKDNFKDGVMQDVHWPSGTFGYFPAYTLGALIAAQLYQTAIKQQPEIPELLTKGDFSLLISWLRENIHTKACSLNFAELLTQASGEPLNVDYFIGHIEKRYLYPS